MPSTAPSRAAWLPWTLVPLAVVGFVALWLLVAFYSGRQCSWMAIVGAIDVLWVLGLQRRLAAPARAGVALASTGLMILLVNWILAATYSGTQVGLTPWEASIRLGPGHALTLAGIANDWRDGVWLAVALGVAAGGPFLSDRLRAPSAR
jgi:hypothetical protein